MCHLSDSLRMPTWDTVRPLPNGLVREAKLLRHLDRASGLRDDSLDAVPDGLPVSFGGHVVEKKSSDELRARKV